MLRWISPDGASPASHLGVSPGVGHSPSLNIAIVCYMHPDSMMRTYRAAKVTKLCPIVSMLLTARSSEFPRICQTPSSAIPQPEYILLTYKSHYPWTLTKFHESCNVIKSDQFRSRKPDPRNPTVPLVTYSHVQPPYTTTFPRPWHAITRG